MTAFSVVVRWLENFPDTPGSCQRHLLQSWKQFALLLLTGLLLRAFTFGDPNLHVDEAFYFLVGQEMHHGSIPYVDIWDRKPLGLFLIYYFIAGISTSVLAYQIVAWLFASSTAMVINCIARRWAGIQGGLLAGACYLAMLGPLEGFGGQTPVFYNLFIASGALLLLNAWPELEKGQPTWRTFAAMALCGLAITVKQTALFEASFFGLFVIYCMARSGAPAVRTGATILACAGLGALPFLAIGTAYCWNRHWHAWWHAMVTSNVAKLGQPLATTAHNSLVMFARLYPVLALSFAGLLIANGEALERKANWFIGLWIAAATMGVLSIPNFYTHYALPLLVPLTIASSPILGRRDVGVFLSTLLVAFSMVLFNPTARGEREQSIQSMKKLTTAIEQHDLGGGLLVYDGPPQLYALSGKRPLTPLSFPPPSQSLDRAKREPV
ncbi:hypothetical protein KRR38_17140 [Novosphingobium sp. G106]|uniref:ArnT family glycosyltransferase n=1 Tax=Novosphingobium sp. G106 TaxID=2849500 RepID=UPI001C2DB908|nr:hypothetical protein [Novosphingobium sp. G106]MBV1689349.1 hypothetical protein [Novosphingobium sp. G106]